ncbi:MAG: hypothetical protein ACYTXC_02455 [Nostoc sp.]
MYVFIYAMVGYVAGLKPLPYQAWIPDEIYAQLYQIKYSFERSLAWQDSEQQNLLHDELLEQRQIARSNMGRKKVKTGNT